MCQHSLWRELCEAGLHDRIVKKPLLRKQNNVKRLQWTKVHKDWKIEQWNKILWSEESKFENFGSNRRIYAPQRIGERTASPFITPTVKHEGGSVTLGGEALSIAKSGIWTRWRANWIRAATIAYCSITWSHLERSLWVKDLYSCKIMTQSIQVNSSRGTLKTNKQKQYVLQLA